MEDQGKKDWENDLGVIIVITSSVTQSKSLRYSSIYCQKNNSRLANDPSYPEIDPSALRKLIGWSSIEMPKR